jgi:hypothetical protein
MDNVLRTGDLVKLCDRGSYFFLYGQPHKKEYVVNFKKVTTISLSHTILARLTLNLFTILFIDDMNGDYPEPALHMSDDCAILLMHCSGKIGWRWSSSMKKLDISTVQ